MIFLLQLNQSKTDRGIIPSVKNQINMELIIKNITPEESLQKGMELREMFLERIASAIKKGSFKKYRHLYIYSPPGLGKTFSVRKMLNELGIHHIELTGNTSIFAFGIMLAVVQYNNPDLLPLIVFVDDSDELFRTEPSCNTMKNALEGANKFTYEKSMVNLEDKLDDLQVEAIRYFKGEGKSGFEVPTHNLTFIFTSNNRLPLDHEVELVKKKGLARSPLVVHRNAIRSRCRVLDFDLNRTEHWGWLADVALHTNCLSELGLDKESTHEILMYLWKHWDNLKERSIRVIEKMGLTIIEQPQDYEKYWKMDFLKVA
ncbi:ATPase family associated with various cellular activities (AAA) [Algoriphagus faecimaris]|uniref:ATPase family associated with various cellular activities (AAA) n=2 Tax=Algoriphagus faecimaris TaxID=686796 RepID=A0A1G6WG97_9BACT|nr:ATPase family associated with various cellular activities (AAA) [Algoriphagus faecimaris]